MTASLNNLVVKRLPLHLDGVQKLSSGGKRIIHGTASTGDIDRVGDIVSPTGGEWALPVPLLYQHKHDEVIGKVVEATATTSGVRIRAELTTATARAREVWELISDGAFLDSFSIGFRVLEREPIKGGGWRYTRWELLETSVVSVAANASAKIGKKYPGTATGAIALTTRGRGSVMLTRTKP